MREGSRGGLRRPLPPRGAPGRLHGRETKQDDEMNRTEKGARKPEAVAQRKNAPAARKESRQITENGSEAQVRARLVEGFRRARGIEIEDVYPGGGGRGEVRP